MARYGFTGGMAETKILILYALSNLALPIPLSQLAEVVMVEDEVDYFVFCQALSEMTESSHVITSETDGVVCYTISPRGYEVGTLMESQLSASLKLVIRQAAQIMVNKVEWDAFVTTEAFTRGGMPTICCELTDGHDPMLHIELMLGDSSQGNKIAKNFKKHAQTIYNQILELLLGEETNT